MLRSASYSLHARGGTAYVTSKSRRKRCPCTKQQVLNYRKTTAHSENSLNAKMRSLMHTHFPQRALQNTAHSLLKKGRLDDALTHFERMETMGIKLSVEDFKLKYQLLLRCKRYSDVIRSFEADFSKFAVQDDLEVLAHVGEAYEKQGLAKEAVGVAEKFVAGTAWNLHQLSTDDPTSVKVIIQSGLRASAKALLRNEQFDSNPEFSHRIPGRFLDYMIASNLAPENEDYYMVLAVLQQNGQIRTLCDVFAKYVESGLEIQSRHVGIFLSAMAALGDFDTVCKLLLRDKSPIFGSDALTTESCFLLVRTARKQIEKIKIPTRMYGLVLVSDFDDIYKMVINVLDQLNYFLADEMFRKTIGEDQTEMVQLLASVKQLVGGLEATIQGGSEGVRKQEALTNLLTGFLSHLWVRWRSIHEFLSTVPTQTANDKDDKAPNDT